MKLRVAWFAGVFAAVAVVAVGIGLLTARRSASAAVVIDLPPIIVIVDPTIDASYDGLHEGMLPKMEALRIEEVAP